VEEDDEEIENDNGDEINFDSGDIGENTWVVKPDEPDAKQGTYSFAIYGAVGVLVLAIVICFSYSICCKRKKAHAMEIQDSDDGEQPAV